MFEVKKDRKKTRHLHGSVVFIVNFQQISHLVVVFTLLALKN